MPLDCRKLHFLGPRADNFKRLVRVRFLVRVGVSWETTDLERDHCFARNVLPGGFFSAQIPLDCRKWHFLAPVLSTFRYW